jgi:2-succinyl-6-hydroxy-2,4-cyclohexadiene-1-carboxylate synthase
MGHPRADELVDEYLERRESAVDRDHLRVPEVVFLPGFMQHADSWSPVAAAVAERYPVTLLEFTTWTFEERLDEIRRAGEGKVLVGYSMGGRLALHAATRWSFAGIATLGASAGIADPRARAERQAADEQLAAWIEGRPIDEVVDRWEQNPVFANQSSDLVAAQRPGRLDHDPADLAGLLRTAGQGALEPIWNDLEDLSTPLLAMAGEKDQTYAEAAEKLRATTRSPVTSVRLVEGCGHAAHLEDPPAVAAILLEWLAQSS